VITPHTGRVLNGGDVTLSDDSGFIVAEPGARIDASGAQSRLDLVGPDGSVTLDAPVTSDGEALPWHRPRAFISTPP